MSAPTESEIPILTQFRNVVDEMGLLDKLTEYQKTDIGLLAWLRARDLNILQASQMLQKSIEWRLENNIENIFQWTAPETYANEFPNEFLGRDNEGRPIILVQFGIWDVKKVISSGEKELFIRYVDRFCCQLIKACQIASQELGHDIYQYNVIVDCDKFSYSQLASFASIETLIDIVRRYESNFPEGLYKAYLINSSRFWLMAYEILKRFLTKRTVDKIGVYTTCSNWMPILCGELPIDVIPIAYGGTNSNTNKLCL